MRLLLDTHTVLWWLKGDDRLSPRALEAISDAGSALLLSAASVWEAAIKVASGKLAAPDLLEEARGSGWEILPITGDHARAAGALPPHHGDPFDRMLVAQATLERLVLVSRDAKLAPYGVPTVW